jgi:hypothetical protein
MSAMSTPPIVAGGNVFILQKSIFDKCCKCEHPSPEDLFEPFMLALEPAA